MAEESQLRDPAKGTSSFRLRIEPAYRRGMMNVAVNGNRKPHVRVDQANPQAVVEFLGRRIQDCSRHASNDRQADATPRRSASWAAAKIVRSPVPISGNRCGCLAVIVPWSISTSTVIESTIASRYPKPPLTNHAITFYHR